MGPFPVGVTYLLIYLLNNYIKKFVWDNNIFIHPSFLKVIFEKVAYFVACFTKWHCISGAFFIDIIYWLQSTSLVIRLSFYYCNHASIDVTGIQAQDFHSFGLETDGYVTLHSFLRSSGISGGSGISENGPAKPGGWNKAKILWII